MSFRYNSGAALITALLMMALLTAMMAKLMFDQSILQRRFAAAIYSSQAQQYAFGGEAWVRDILRQDGVDSSIDYLDEIWAQEMPPLPIEGGFIIGKIEDLQGRINLNNLVNNAGDID
ncbi:MAG: general secretion pathway protein GspK, partial [Gammaproteobacteria bacterium]|nr:general secretion pathway protein GspK [Gammaproteobacteria bacterium]